ncbi:hypothetical protein M0R72_04065 [Candidatus Pacearchaeota archaeon]|jgi:hypothetical protein|nr:hypothetical protein [Candidatus Pacearchaeota archaeon]
MGIFGKKKDKVIDLRENYKIPEKSFAKVPAKNNSSDMSAFGFMDNSSSSSSSSNDSDYVNLSSDNSDKKSKIAKRLLDMTDKLEDISNQIYHIKQRIEIIEKKLKISYD